MKCNSMASSYWDKGACQCRSKTVAIRGAGDQFDRCGNSKHGTWYMSNMRMNNMVMLAISLVITLIMLTTTLRYRRKYNNKLLRQQSKMDNLPTKHESKKEEKRRQKMVRKMNKIKAESYEALDKDVIEQLLGQTDCELYGDQEYDQHGVRIDHQYMD